MTETEIAFWSGELFDKKIAAAFWDSFKTEYGRIQVEILVHLYEKREAQASEIAEALGTPKQHVSKIIIGLSRDGMVNVKQNDSDRRANIVSLSPAGMSYMKKHIELSNAHYQKLISTLTEEQRSELHKAMKTVGNILSEL